jgi:hypothetical protein
MKGKEGESVFVHVCERKAGCECGSVYKCMKMCVCSCVCVSALTDRHRHTVTQKDGRTDKQTNKQMKQRIPLSAP